MPARRRPATARVTDPAEPGLRLHADGDRYSTLLKERERLLRGIRTKKQKLELALESSREARSAVLERLEPFLERFEASSVELRALFEELLAPGRLSASAVREVARVRRTMVDLGFLGEPVDDEPLDDEEYDAEGHPGGAEHSTYPPAGDDEPASQDYGRRDVRSAEQRGQAKDRESLRAVFKRLVAASHPDRASNEADRERRTAAMKLATQAYQQGDLARLLELETAWRRGQSLPPPGSAEATCRELELVIRELRAQASQLQRELRGAQASASLTPETESVAQALEEAQEDAEHLEKLRNFVISFRDGKISLREFIQGPTPPKVEEDLEAILFEVFRDQPSPVTKQPSRPRAKPKRRSKG